VTQEQRCQQLLSSRFAYTCPAKMPGGGARNATCASARPKDGFLAALLWSVGIWLLSVGMVTVRGYLVTAGANLDWEGSLRRPSPPGGLERGRMTAADELIRPVYDAKGLAARLGIPEHAVHALADRTRELLKVTTTEGVDLSPAFQIDSAGSVLPHLREVLDPFATIDDTWTIARWVKAPSGRLDGRSPAEALRAGEKERVVAVASSFGSRLSG
jgi:hypothetical protein